MTFYTNEKELMSHEFLEMMHETDQERELRELRAENKRLKIENELHERGGSVPFSFMGKPAKKPHGPCVEHPEFPGNQCVMCIHCKRGFHKYEVRGECSAK